jgi:DNA mismatch repair protein MutS
LKTNFIFATHFHELINYEEITGIQSMKMMHLSVTYDRERDCLLYDRKLKDGPGDSNYGLIVAKSLYLPDDFLENAYDFRRKYFSQVSAGELSNSTTKYNAKKIRGVCEMCKCAIADEIHHLAPQSLANNNYIDSFHKNHPANLMGLCNKCHLKEHEEERTSGKIIAKRRKKTTQGYVLAEETKS